MDKIKIANLFEGLPPALSEELFDTLASSGGVRVERIVSLGQCSPEGEWFVQDWDEWVLLLAGEARLLLEGEPSPRRLVRGDHLLIPAHCRHRVTWTDPDNHTIWLAVHFARH